jgi:hypothetical protein
VLLRGTVDTKSFASEARLTSPATLAAMARVRLIPREDWPTILGHGGQVTVVTTDGCRFTQYLATALGGTAYPLSLDQVADVSSQYFEQFMSAESHRRVRELLVDLEAQPDVRELMSLLCTGVGA